MAHNPIRKIGNFPGAPGLVFTNKQKLELIQIFVINFSIILD